MVKFICIKGIIILIFLQSLIVNLLFYTGAIKVNGNVSDTTVARCIKETLNVVEMSLVFTFAFMYAFDPEE